MGWLFKMLLRLLVLAAIVFVVWALFADLPPPTDTRTVPLPTPAPSGTADG